MKNVILIVDDEPLVLSSLWRCLLNEQLYDIVTALSGEEALAIMCSRNINVVISDQNLARMQGIDFLTLVNIQCPEAVKILLTENASLELAVMAINQAEVYRFLTKPWVDAELLQIVASAIEKSKAQQKTTDNRRYFQPQFGELDRLERVHPGISQMCKDSAGNLMLNDISDAELDEFSNRWFTNNLS